MLRIVSFTLLSAAAAFGQATSAPPSFDVASIKASPPEGMRHNAPFGNNVQATPGSVTMHGVTLKACIAWAYHVFEYQVNGPDWTGVDKYEIAAKAGGPAAEAELRVMLQTLLADRFHLTVHRQTKEMSAYLLQIGKNGPKFKESKEEGESSIDPDQKTMTVTAHRVPISQLVDMLSRVFQTPVLDQTGLTGRYDVAINVTKYISQPVPDPLTLVQTAMAEELGLKLEAKKSPVDLIVIDRAEKAPTEN